MAGSVVGARDEARVAPNLTRAQAKRAIEGLEYLHPNAPECCSRCADTFGAIEALRGSLREFAILLAPSKEQAQIHRELWVQAGEDRQPQDAIHLERSTAHNFPPRGPGTTVAFICPGAESYPDFDYLNHLLRRRAVVAVPMCPCGAPCKQGQTFCPSCLEHADPD